MSSRLARRAPALVLALSAAAAVVVFACGRDDGPDAAPAPVMANVGTPDDGTDARLAETQRRSAAKRALIEELAEGRRTLAETAAAFAALDEGPVAESLAVSYYPGAPAGERYCRLVVKHTAATLRGDPRRPAVLARLRAELEVALADHRSPPPAEPAG